VHVETENPLVFKSRVVYIVVGDMPVVFVVSFGSGLVFIYGDEKSSFFAVDALQVVMEIRDVCFAPQAHRG
jgi:hypothetical protein